MPSKFQKVYVVRGSEDGTLGVFGNFKAAHSCAVNYLTQWSPDAKCTSYKEALKYKSIATIDRDIDYVTADIELFYFNHDFNK